jgi:uncharacterized membrane protein YeaQ/YmgE (transglycosylase-associated protein family)
LSDVGCHRLFSTGYCARRADGRSFHIEAMVGPLMYLSGESIVVILLVGLIAGWLAGKIVQGTGFGLIGDMAIGIVGAFIASWLFPRLGIGLGVGLIRAIINSTIGAVLLLVIIRLVRRGGRW